MCGVVRITVNFVLKSPFVRAPVYLISPLPFFLEVLTLSECLSLDLAFLACVSVSVSLDDHYVFVFFLWLSMPVGGAGCGWVCGRVRLCLGLCVYVYVCVRVWAVGETTS